MAILSDVCPKSFVMALQGAGLGALILLAPPVSGQPRPVASSQCGEAPRVDDQEIKGEIEGEAQFLSAFLGDASLTGNIQASRKDVFSKSPEGMRSRADAYLQYQVCLLVMADTELSTSAKISELLRVQEAFREHEPSAR